MDANSTTYPMPEIVDRDVNHEASIAAARKAAAEAGVGERVRFEVADAARLPGDGYDLGCFFDCLHDMGDPVDAARRTAQRRHPLACRGDGGCDRRASTVIEAYAERRRRDRAARRSPTVSWMWRWAQTRWKRSSRSCPA